MADGFELPTVVLFGAFDRHNFGDLLFPHVVSALLPGRRLVFAGLAERDLRAQGGHATVPVSRLLANPGLSPAVLIHVGGEILTCEAWQAAVMLLPPDEVQPTIAYFEAHPQERLDWVHRYLGSSARAPYSLSRVACRGLSRVVYNAVGGVELDRADPALCTEVRADLEAADAVSVRDRVTQRLLAALGIEAGLVPDPAVMVAELFGQAIRSRARTSEVAQVRRAFPQGYIAVQLGPDFGDDATLAQVAAELDRMCGSTGFGVALFRAGAAPWHDDLDLLGRVAARMRHGSATLFESLNLWDICGLIAHSRAYCGSSLHGRIVAMAFALPGVSLQPAALAGRTSKLDAFAQTWDADGMPAVAGLSDIAAGLAAALAVDPQALGQKAAGLARRYRRSFGTLALAL